MAASIWRPQGGWEPPLIRTTLPSSASCGERDLIWKLNCFRNGRKIARRHIQSLPLSRFDRGASVFTRGDSVNCVGRVVPQVWPSVCRCGDLFLKRVFLTYRIGRVAKNSWPSTVPRGELLIRRGCLPSRNGREEKNFWSPAGLSGNYASNVATRRAAKAVTTGVC